MWLCVPSFDALDHRLYSHTIYDKTNLLLYTKIWHPTFLCLHNTMTGIQGLLYDNNVPLLNSVKILTVRSVEKFIKFKPSIKYQFSDIRWSNQLSTKHKRCIFKQTRSFAGNILERRTPHYKRNGLEGWLFCWFP